LANGVEHLSNTCLNHIFILNQEFSMTKLENLWND